MSRKAFNIIIIIFMVFLASIFAVACGGNSDETDYGTSGENGTGSAVTMVGIEIASPATVTEYYVGDELNVSGLSINAVYSNDTKVAVSLADCSVTPSNELSMEDSVAYIEYMGHIVTYSIVVNEVYLEQIVVVPPTKVDYYEGEMLDISGMQVIVLYNNADAVAVTDYVVDMQDTPLTSDITSIIVSYGECSTSFDITVDPVEMIGMDVAAGTCYYIEGDMLSTDDMVVTALYNNGDDEIVEDGYTLSIDRELVVDDTVVTVAYGDFVASFNIMVVPVAMIGIEVTAVVNQYIEGDYLSESDIAVVIIYNNGDEIYVEDGYTLSIDRALEVTDEVITVTYEGYSADYDITVEGLAVVSISVTPPDKIEYIEGEELDLAGMVVIATYHNGEEREIESGYIVSPDRALTCDDISVTITYFGKADAFAVTVSPQSGAAEYSSVVEAEDIYSAGYAPSGENHVVCVSGSYYISACGTYIENISNGAVLEFHLWSTVTEVRSLVLRAMSECKIVTDDGTVYEEMSLAECISMTVNGKSYALSSGLVLDGGDEPTWAEVTLGDVQLYAGENIITITINSNYISSGSASASALAIDWLAAV